MGVRSPYQTMTRAKARLYIMDCVQAGRDVVIAEAVKRGVASDRRSARRAIRFELEKLICPVMRA